MLVPLHRNPRTLRSSHEQQSDQPASRKRRRSFLDALYRRIDEDLEDR